MKTILGGLVPRGTVRSVFVATIGLSAALGVLCAPVSSYAQAILITPSITHSVADQGKIKHELVRCVPDAMKLGFCEGQCTDYRSERACYNECRRRYACGQPL